MVSLRAAAATDAQACPSTEESSFTSSSEPSQEVDAIIILLPGEESEEEIA